VKKLRATGLRRRGRLQELTLRGREDIRILIKNKSPRITHGEKGDATGEEKGEWSSCNGRVNSLQRAIALLHRTAGSGYARVSQAFFFEELLSKRELSCARNLADGKHCPGTILRSKIPCYFYSKRAKRTLTEKKGKRSLDQKETGIYTRTKEKKPARTADQTDSEKSESSPPRAF